MNKKGVSPLISTVILIIMAMGIGVLVMNWGRAQIEANAKCTLDTEWSIVELNNVPQICFSGTETGFVKFLVENGPNTNIEAIQLTAIGSKSPYNTLLLDSGIEKGFTLQKVVPYDFNTFGDIKKIKLIPRIVIFANDPPLLCPEQSLTIENIPECE